MPLTHKGKKIEHAMEKEYGEKKGKSVFYASINKGKIHGAEGSKEKALEHKRGKKHLKHEKNESKEEEREEHK
jgi:hypothetical protein